MIPQTISENLMYITTRILTKKNAGSGFFFVFPSTDPNVVTPVIVTNKHVLDNNPQEEVTFEFHTHVNGTPQEKSIRYTFKGQWLFHSKHDLCFTFLAPMIYDIKAQLNQDVFYRVVSENEIFSNDKLAELSAIEEVIMVGYPNGLYDSKNNFPLFRKGITASHPSVDFNLNGIGAVDMACFPGSSGSPIFILNEGSYQDKKGSMYIGKSRFIFLGILYKGPRITEEGKIEIVDIPTSTDQIVKTNVMMNLGYYIKANELLEFKEIVSKISKA